MAKLHNVNQYIKSPAPADFNQTEHSHGTGTETSRVGMRARLRREASHNRVIQTRMSQSGIGTEERINALHFPWLRALFNSAASTDAVLNTQELSPRVRAIISQTVNDIEPEWLKSEQGLLEAIYHQLSMIEHTPLNMRHGLYRNHCAEHLNTLLLLVKAWEESLRH